MFFSCPDPLTNIGGKQRFGFDEYSLLFDICEALKRTAGDRWRLLIKIHPNQSQDNFVDIISALDANVLTHVRIFP